MVTWDKTEDFNSYTKKTETYFSWKSEGKLSTLNKLRKKETKKEITHPDNNKWELNEFEAGVVDRGSEEFGRDGGTVIPYATGITPVAVTT